MALRPDGLTLRSEKWRCGQGMDAGVRRVDGTFGKSTLRPCFTGLTMDAGVRRKCRDPNGMTHGSDGGRNGPNG